MYIIQQVPEPLSCCVYIQFVVSLINFGKFQSFKLYIMLANMTGAVFKYECIAKLDDIIFDGFILSKHKFVMPNSLMNQTDVNYICEADGTFHNER